MPEEQQEKRISVIKFILSRPEGQKLAAASMLVVIFLVGVIGMETRSYYKTIQDGNMKCEIAYKRAIIVIDSLKNEALRASEETNKRLQARILWEDSVKQTLQLLLYKNVNNVKTGK